MVQKIATGERMPGEETRTKLVEGLEKLGVDPVGGLRANRNQRVSVGQENGRTPVCTRSKRPVARP